MKVTEEGWRQPKYCLHFVRWYQPQIIADCFPLFRFIYHAEEGFHKTSTLLHSPNPLSNFWCTPSLISHAPYGARQLPPGGSQGGTVRIRLGYHEAIGAYRETPLRLAKSRLMAVARLHGACGRTSQALWACQFPFQGRQEWLRIGILVSHVDKRVEMLYIIFDCIFQIKIQKRIGEDRCIWTITSAGGPRSWRMRR